MYQDKLAGIQKQLQQLRDGTHSEYVKQLKILELQQKNQYLRQFIHPSSYFNVKKNLF